MARRAKNTTQEQDGITAPINIVSKEKATRLKVAGDIDLDAFVKACATGASMRIMRSIDDAPVTQRLTTGDRIIDLLLGGGVPVGKQIEIIGYQSSGKTSLAIEILIQLINQYNGYAFVVDHEDESWDFPTRQIKLGLDESKLNRIVYGDYDTIEGVFEGMERFIETVCIKNKVRDVPVGLFVDSIAAFSSKEEIEAQYGLDGYPTQARIIAKGHRKLRSLLAKNNIKNVFFVFLNQAKDAIAKDRFHAPEIETLGGKAVRFFSAIRIMMEHQKQLAMNVNDKPLPVGIKVKLKTIKNKTFPALQSATLRIMFKNGFDNVSNVFDFITERTKLIKDTTVNEAKALFDALPESSGLTEKEYDKKFKAYYSSIPYKMTLENEQTLHFDKGVSFRRIFKEHGEMIVSTLTKHFNEMIEKATQSIAGFEDDPTLYDNIAEIDDNVVDSASAVNASAHLPLPRTHSEADMNID